MATPLRSLASLSHTHRLIISSPAAPLTFLRLGHSSAPAIRTFISPAPFASEMFPDSSRLRLVPPTHPTRQPLLSPTLKSFSSQPGPQTEPPSGLFGRVRQLGKQYGSAALVVYVVLGAVDFGLSFVMIYLVGAEHVRRAEDWVLERLSWKRDTATAGVSQERAADGLNSMLWTTAVVAYAIHKLLLPLRVGLTAWITPPLVRALRKRGWKVGKTLTQ